MDAVDPRSDQPTPLVLTAEQSSLLHRETCRLLEAAARQRNIESVDVSLGELASRSVVGVFITLRKQRELRGCIGNFAAATPLGGALQRAAAGVVRHDSRFPPVDADELPQLTVTVSLLHTRELLSSQRDRRVTEVDVGTHGLDIQYRGCKGLLLPSVATDFGLDSIGFLNAVCRKAGLPEETWQDPDATLYRFGALVIDGAWAV